EAASHGKSRDHGHWPFTRLGVRMRSVLPALLICLLAPTGPRTAVAQMSHPKAATSPSDAQKAFEKLKSLAGPWQGPTIGICKELSIRVTSSGSAIHHEATASGRPDNPITMLYVDGDRLLLTHYCDSGNRPRMEGKLSPDGKSVEFGFLDVAGSTERG